jgi:predicted anti-sigma-YlaC factor YlaD
MRSRMVPSDECKRACEWISLRQDSQLSDFEEVLLAAHLRHCLDCRGFAEGVARVTELIRATPLEEPTFAFELPRRGGAWAHGLRTVSAVAAVGIIGLSGLVGLQLSGSRVPGAVPRADRALIGLKEVQMDELDGITQLESTAQRTSRTVRPNLAAAEQATVGTTHTLAQVQSPRPAARRLAIDD